MVPARSHKVSRVSWYSGYRHVISAFRYGAFTLSGWLSQNHSPSSYESFMRSEPRSARTPVCPLSISLAATLEIDVSFSSSGYLDVSVHRVPFLTLWIGVRMTEVCSAGFPHSDISGSWDICSSPKLFAAYHVFRRLLVPRHPPYALSSITNYSLRGYGWNYTCIALHALVNRSIFSIRFLRIFLVKCYNIYLGCLDIRFKFCQRLRYSGRLLKACFHKDFSE